LIDILERWISGFPCGAGLQATTDTTTGASAIPYLQQAFRLAPAALRAAYIEVVL
jgi:hypothetical protein